MNAKTGNIEQTIAELRGMSAGQLREKYLEVMGEPSCSGNKDYLFKRLAWRLQSLAEGGLSERAGQPQRVGGVRAVQVRLVSGR